MEKILVKKLADEETKRDNMFRRKFYVSWLTIDDSGKTVTKSSDIEVDNDFLCNDNNFKNEIIKLDRLGFDAKIFVLSWSIIES